MVGMALQYVKTTFGDKEDDHQAPTQKFPHISFFMTMMWIKPTLLCKNEKKKII